LEPLAIIIVLTAAVLHASWSAMVKNGGEPWVRMGIVTFITGSMGLTILPFVDAPAPASWPYLAASIAIHQVYFCFVCFGYQFGALSQVYPIQRGVAPMLVAIGSYFFIGETLNTQGILSVSLISISILSLAFGQNCKFTGGRAIPIALFTGILIAGYTIVDGKGVRLAGDNIIGYIAWLFALEAIPFTLLCLWLMKIRPKQITKQHILTSVGGGIMAFFAYGLVIWAMSLSHLTYVSALRETSVILAAWIGTQLMGEPFGKNRIIAAIIISISVLTLQISDTGETLM
jgi:drug/metabolite transporter (DMT)-like permease